MPTKRRFSDFKAEDFEVELYAGGSDRITHVDLYSGMGGFSDGVKACGGVTTLAVDIDKHARSTYKFRHSGVPFLLRRADDADVRERLMRFKPNFITAGTPCTDASPMGKRIEGEAMRELERVADLIIESGVPTALLENVVEALRTDAWRRARSALHISGYDTYVVHAAANAFGAPTRRRRVYILVQLTSPGSATALQRFGMYINTNRAACETVSVRDVLDCDADAYYLRTRTHRPAVYSTDGLLPTLLSSHFGAIPVDYHARSNDFCGIAEAKELTLPEVAALQTLPGTLPPPSLVPRTALQLQMANAAIPAVVEVLVRSAMQAMLLRDTSEKQRPVRRGREFVHDDAPPAPAWFRPDIKAAYAAMTKAAAMLADPDIFASSSEAQDPNGDDHDDINAAWPEPAEEGWGEGPTASAAATCGEACCAGSACESCSSRPTAAPRSQRCMLVKAVVAGKDHKLRLLLDPGAEISILSPEIASSLGVTLCKLRKGDVSAIVLGDNATSKEVQGIAHVWMHFGGRMFKHDFVVADMGGQALLGLDFIHRHKSTLAQGGAVFLADGTDATEVHTFACREQPPLAYRAASVTGQSAAEKKDDERDQAAWLEDRSKVKQAVVTAEDVVLAPMSETVVGLRLTPEYAGDRAYDALLEIHPQYRLNANKQSFGVAEGLVNITPGAQVYARVINASNKPMVLRAGKELALAVPAPLDETCYAVMGDAQDYHDAAAAATQWSATAASGEDPVAAAVAAFTSTRTGEPAPVFAEVPSGEDDPGPVTDDEIEQLLMVDGKLKPAFEGYDAEGEPRADAARAMFRGVRGAFAKDAKNPGTSTCVGEIDIDTGTAKPVADKARRYAQRETEFIMEYVRQALKNRVIEPSDSAWASNPLIVRQATKLRFCIDFRRLNAVTKRDSHGLGNIEDMLERLHGSALFSTFDLAAGYNQIPLSRSARAKTAFRTPNGELYQYRVAPFGLVNLPAEFTRIMHAILGDVLGAFAMVYLDDILVHSASFDEHLLHVERVLKRVVKGNISISLPKTHVFEEELDFLGHSISADGARPQSQKVAAMQDMSPPLKAGQLDRSLVQCVVGVFNYYRRYVKDYSSIAAPILKLQRHETEQLWTPECQVAFDELKCIMASRPVVRHANFNEPFFLQTDAASTSISGILTQFERLPTKSATDTRDKRVAGGAQAGEYVVGYYSKLCSAQESKWSQVELEAYAVVMSLLNFRGYLWGRPVTVITDAAALCWLLSMRGNNGKLLRWAMRIQEFDAVFQHRAGKLNNADALSRLAQASHLRARELRPEPDGNEDWPATTDVGDLQDTGVKFSQDSATLAVIAGACAKSEHGPPFRFNDWYVASEARLTDDAHARAACTRVAAFQANEGEEHGVSALRTIGPKPEREDLEREPTYEELQHTMASMPLLGLNEHLTRVASLSVPDFKQQRDLEPGRCFICKAWFTGTRQEHDAVCDTRAAYDLVRQCPKRERDPAKKAAAAAARAALASEAPTASRFAFKLTTRVLSHSYEVDEEQLHARVAALTRGQTQAAAQREPRGERSSPSRRGSMASSRRDPTFPVRGGSEPPNKRARGPGKQRGTRRSIKDDSRSPGKRRRVSKSKRGDSRDSRSDCSSSKRSTSGGDSDSSSADSREERNKTRRAPGKGRKRARTEDPEQRSRGGSPPAAAQEPEEDPLTHGEVAGHYGEHPLDRKLMLRLQKTDPFCSEALRRLRGEEMGDHRVAVALEAEPNSYVVEEDGLLVHLAPARLRGGEHVVQVVVPSSLRALALRFCHDDSCAGHDGVARTLSRALQRFYWPSIAKDTSTYVRSCIVCSRINAPNTRRVPVVVQALSQGPMFNVHIDLLDMHCTTKDGYRYMGVAVCSFTKWLWLMALKNKDALEAVRLMYRICMEQGAIARWTMDRGGEWRNDCVAHLCKLLEMKRAFTSPYHPQTNGRAEEMNRQVLKAIRSWGELRQGEWADGLELLQLKLRTTPDSSTGLTPFFGLYAREAYMPLDLELGAGPRRSRDLHQDIERRRDLMELAAQAVHSDLARRRDMQERLNAQIKNRYRFKVRDLVMVQAEPDPDNVRKLEPRYSGPWVLEQDVGERGVTFACKLQGRTVKYTTFHARRLKPFHERPIDLRSQRVQDPVSAAALKELPTEQQLSAVLDRKWAGARWLYKLQLRDGSETDWISEKVALKFSSASALDSFHVLYELYNSPLPRYAKRAAVAKEKTLTREQALRRFPLDLPVARAEELDSSRTTVIGGKVSGYLSPWWRCSFDDGTWCEWTKTEMLEGLRLRKVTDARGLQEALKKPPSAPVVYHQTFSGSFPGSCKGQRIELLFDDGWTAGTIKSGKGSKYEVLFDYETGRRTCSLRIDNYHVAEDAAVDAWRWIKA